jgi:hypothetical protein
MGKTYIIKYNDGVFAESITFTDKNEDYIKNYLTKEIEEFNKNINRDYHITWENIYLV